MPLYDPLVPAERVIQRGLAHLPPWISRWLGYRGTAGPAPRNWIICLWGFIGAFGGVASIMAVFGHSSYFHNIHLVPPIVASFGASAILCYGSIDVPLAQPRALVFGHFFSGLIGVIIATIFAFDLDADPYPRLQWLAAALATAIALVVMHLTKTTHPPAGATALIPCVDPHIWALRWYYLPVLLLMSSIVLASALLVNNVQRQYPKFWVAQIPPPAQTPAPVAKPAPAEKHGDSPNGTLRDLETGPAP